MVTSLIVLFAFPLDPLPAIDVELSRLDTQAKLDWNAVSRTWHSSREKPDQGAEFMYRFALAERLFWANQYFTSGIEPGVSFRAEKNLNAEDATSKRLRTNAANPSSKLLDRLTYALNIQVTGSDGGKPLLGVKSEYQTMTIDGKPERVLRTVYSDAGQAARLSELFVGIVPLCERSGWGSVAFATTWNRDLNRATKLAEQALKLGISDPWVKVLYAWTKGSWIKRQHATPDIRARLESVSKQCEQLVSSRKIVLVPKPPKSTQPKGEAPAGKARK